MEEFKLNEIEVDDKFKFSQLSNFYRKQPSKLRQKRIQTKIKANIEYHQKLQKFKKYIDRAEARDNATRSLCRAEMISICHKAQKENCIAYYNLENLEHLFEAYKALGGNGAMEKLYNKTIKLPQEKDD